MSWKIYLGYAISIHEHSLHPVIHAQVIQQFQHYSVYLLVFITCKQKSHLIQRSTYILRSHNCFFHKSSSSFSYYCTMLVMRQFSLINIYSSSQLERSTTRGFGVDLPLHFPQPVSYLDIIFIQSQWFVSFLLIHCLDTIKYFTVCAV